MADSCDADKAPPNVWLPELVERFASCLDPVFVAWTLRLVDKATAEQFRGRPEYPSVVRLSQPVPPQTFAARWAPPGAMRDLTLEQRQKLLRLTAVSGVVANLEVALGAVDFIPNRRLWAEILEATAAAGQEAAVRCLVGFGYGEPNRKTLCVVAGAGHQAVCEVLLGRARSFGTIHGIEAYVAAALRGGQPELADWLLQRWWEEPIGPADSLEPLGKETCLELLHAATEGCDLPTLQSIHQRCSEVVHGDDDMVRIAAGSRTTDWQAKVEWWESQLPPDWLYDDPGVCTAAASCPDADIRLAWLLGRGYPTEKYALRAVVGSGNTAALELLFRMAAREGNVPLLVEAVEQLGTSDQDPLLSEPAEDVCDLEVLRWLRQRGCQLNGTEVARSAVRRGQLAVLAWAAEELGASVQSADLMDAAAASGSVEVMAWLRERGCPWGLDTFAEAADSGCVAAMEWLAERGCPFQDGWAYKKAACNRDLAALRCLARLGCPWGTASGARAVFSSCLDCRCRPLPVLRLLVELGCPVDWEACRDQKFVYGETREWLLAQAAAAAQGVAL
ncbi:hypothetical protein GPECTOR_25g425 [Gonium pectorale]|uniref:Ankyrin repeat domain-containing protein n=1 Tax=Gonium pectorale TaxID=33097 RepID=A0A150GHK5_GONPE|nr:hypothetical protein GPECTOR_25g425 [Gonium pectorale]|eukprot:KXZ48840.1 hypothetical protein GPECTOR_25g425 [Gonium pectorale]